MRDNAEFRLSCWVADRLREFARPDVWWTHFPAGEHRSEVAGARLKRMGLRRGVPDYIFWLPNGRTAFLELKVGKGRLSPEQTAFMDAMVGRGHVYQVARSGQEAVEILRGWGILERIRAVA